MSLYFKPIFQNIILPKENEKLFGSISLTEEIIINSISEFAKNGKVLLDLDQILGEGGEGLVVEQEISFMENTQKCAVKFTHYETDEHVFGMKFFIHLQKSKEFLIGANSLHEFRIKQLCNTIVKLNGELFHVTSKLLFY